MGSESMIAGIYYEEKALSMGTAGTHKVSADTHALHYYLRENGKGEVEVCYLRPDGTPTSMVVETITREQFAARFKDCSAHECEFRKRSPEEKKAALAAEKTRVGNAHLEKSEFHAATFEFGLALKADDKHLEAHLGKGKAHMALGQVDKAKEHFEKMAAINTLFDKENKHTFNELGITLRRGGMYDEALRNYHKAIEIDADDPALYFNMARAYKEMGDIAQAMASLQKALELKPDFAEAIGFLKSLKG